MIERKLTPPTKSFFLLGPRGTGKTTWLRETFRSAKWFNLLRNSEYLRLAADPTLFRKEVEILPPGSTIIVDEIQRYPELLNEVHDILSSFPKGHFLFSLTGSSARKLRRGGVNLLAGRAIQRKMFPLVSAEIGPDFSFDQALNFGTLPDSWLAESDAERIDYLKAYLDTYIREEIKEEALVRRLDPFARFLNVAALMNGQQTNLANIARDAGVPRPTVQGYFSVLEDTLIGSFLPTWQPKAKVKETGHPKFYFFDTGIVRALTFSLPAASSDLERGILLETLIINEIKAYVAYSNLGGQLYFWRSAHGTEVDLVYIGEGKNAIKVGFEIKSSSKWRNDYSKVLKGMLEDRTLDKGYGVYLGATKLKDDTIIVMDAQSFLRSLWNGQVI